MKTIKCQVELPKVCSNGWNEVLPIWEDHIYIYIYVCAEVLDFFQGIEEPAPSTPAPARAADAAAAVFRPLLHGTQCYVQVSVNKIVAFLVKASSI